MKGENGEKRWVSQGRSVDARFPHLKHPFLEMLYAIYKRKIANEDYIQLFSFHFFDFHFFASDVDSS